MKVVEANDAYAPVFCSRRALEYYTEQTQLVPY